MERIVILCNPSEQDRRLIASLCILFPECEIQVQPRRVENFGDVCIVPGPGKAEGGGENDVKDFNCR